MSYLRSNFFVPFHVPFAFLCPVFFFVFLTTGEKIQIHTFIYAAFMTQTNKRPFLGSMLQVNAEVVDYHVLPSLTLGKISFM